MGLDVVTPGEHVGSAETIYRARADAFSAEWLALSRHFNLVANLRLGAFVAAAAWSGVSRGTPWSASDWE
jgi:hypothetical protein